MSQPKYIGYNVKSCLLLLLLVPGVPISHLVTSPILPIIIYLSDIRKRYLKLENVQLLIFFTNWRDVYVNVILMYVNSFLTYLILNFIDYVNLTYTLHVRSLGTSTDRWWQYNALWRPGSLRSIWKLLHVTCKIYAWHVVDVIQR